MKKNIVEIKKKQTWKKL